MKIWIIFLGALMTSGNCIANGSYTGKFKPFFYSNTLYLIPFEAQILNKPACATRRYIRLPSKTGGSDI